MHSTLRCRPRSCGRTFIPYSRPQMHYKRLVPKVTPPLGNSVRYRAVDVGNLALLAPLPLIAKVARLTRMFRFYLLSAIEALGQDVLGCSNCLFRLINSNVFSKFIAGELA